ncbi:MAG TPA: hypothetical protein VNJ02_06625 [Vicinamibacterales bacterium]|nr:hypothetical protein [Vicinamibacterales bacterium]
MSTISIRISEPATLTTSNAAIQTMPAWTRLTSWFQQTWCFISGGHHKVLHTAPDKMALLCVSCGHQSSGWDVGTPRLARTTVNAKKPVQRPTVQTRRPIAA